MAKSPGMDNPSARSVHTDAPSKKKRTRRDAGIDGPSAPCHIDTASGARPQFTEAPASQPKDHPMPTRDVTIGGIAFTIEDRYAEGHSLNVNEASQLNQVRAENIGNNFRDKIAKAREAAYREANGLPAEGDLPEGAKVSSDQALSDDVVAALRAELTEAAGKYEFGARSGGGRTLDPVQREAKRLATERVEAAIRAKHGSLSAVSKERVKELVDGLAAREDIQALAAANVEAAKGLALDLDLESST